MFRQTAGILQLNKAYKLDCLSDVTMEASEEKSPGQNISRKREMSSVFSIHL